VEGFITVSAQIDSTQDYSGIELIVTDGQQDGPDTLGYAITDTDGAFSMDVDASDRGVFPFVIKRGGSVINVAQFVVAPSDTVSIRAELPLGNRIPIIKSYENSAWAAFRNAEAAHSDRVNKLLGGQDANAEQLRQSIEQASGVLWSIRNTYPGTMAADVASAKSVVMLDGWNDSLLVVRLQELDPEAPGFAETVQAGGRAETRLHGLAAGVELLTTMRDKTERPDAQAAIQREIALAYLDMGAGEEAFAAAESLKVNYAGTEWAEWAGRAQYAARNLMPGMPAPDFTLKTRTGGTVDLDSLRGKVVVLEFWAPRDRQAAQDLSSIRQIVESDAWSMGIEWVSVGLEVDDDLYEAFFEGRTVPGTQVRDTEDVMQDLIRRFNVEVVPTRYLIDQEGRIVRKYTGNTLLELSAEIENMAAEG
jgi:hypothetical protein